MFATDDYDQFSEYVIMLLKDKELRREISKNSLLMYLKCLVRDQSRCHLRFPWVTRSVLLLTCDRTELFIMPLLLTLDAKRLTTEVTFQSNRLINRHEIPLSIIEGHR